MEIANLLELKPFYGIVKTVGGPPKDTVPFIGCPRQHPSDKNRIVLIYDPLGQNTRLLEFKLEDVLCVEDVLSAVTEKGEGVPLIKLWIRRGAHGVILEPFEVEDSTPFATSPDQHERFLRPPLR
ncbi:MAG: hypothetical protein LBL19_07195 [Spirochaetaceae bacterium]|jgi:hypothetical protein|nr:hypothetical protein [Spirochaetaceae bacterium]